MAEPTTKQKKWVAGTLVEPINGPGFTRSKLTKIKVSGNVFKRDTYDGAELRRYEGRPEANDHMLCGSVVNGKRIPYTPPKPVCVGAAGSVIAAIGGRKLAV